MRLYETTFLIAPTLPEEEAEKLIEKMAGIIPEKNGEKTKLRAKLLPLLPRQWTTLIPP